MHREKHEVRDMEEEGRRTLVQREGNWEGGKDGLDSGSKNGLPGSCQFSSSLKFLLFFFVLPLSFHYVTLFMLYLFFLEPSPFLFIFPRLVFHISLSLSFFSSFPLLLLYIFFQVIIFILLCFSTISLKCGKLTIIALNLHAYIWMVCFSVN